MTGYILQESKLASIEKSIPDEPRVHCLVCKGQGNQWYSACDLSYKGLVWTQDQFNVAAGFKDANGILISHGDAKFADLQNDYQWKVETYEKLQLEAGDFVTLKPTKGESEYLSITEMAIDAKGCTTLQLGAAAPKFTDTWDILQQISRGYSDKYLRQAHAAVTVPTTTPWYPSDPAHAAVRAELTFAVPAGVTDSSLLPRVTITPTISVSGDIPDWVLNPTYIEGQKVNNSAQIYLCIVSHIAIASREPGVGAFWTTYWLAIDEILLELGRTAIDIWIDDVKAPICSLVGYPIGASSESSLPEIDITDYVTDGQDAVISTGVSMSSEYGTPHTAFSDHQEIHLSITMNFYKRMEMK